jgi:uncharacterized membrane protein YdbT with pleckstrin-like domain
VEDRAPQVVVLVRGDADVEDEQFSPLRGAVARDRELLRPEVSGDEIGKILVASSPSIGFYAAAIALAIVAPRAAAFGYLVIAVVAALRVPGDEVPAEPA